MGFAKEINAARLAKDMGYPIAGGIEDIYEGAKILIPGIMFGWVNDHGETDPEQSARYDKEFITGEVIHIQSIVVHGELEKNDPNDDIGYDELDAAYQNTVATIRRRGQRVECHYVMHFTLRTSENLQVPLSYGKGHDVFFAQPE